MMVRDPADGAHTRVLNGTKYSWKVKDLWELAARLPVFQVEPQAIINLDKDGWFVGQQPTLRLVLEHVRRIQDADLSYPVILDADGAILDGAHRVAKAILEGRSTIDAVQFRSLPTPTRTEAVSGGEVDSGAQQSRPLRDI